MLEDEDDWRVLKIIADKIDELRGDVKRFLATFCEEYWKQW